MKWMRNVSRPSMDSQSDVLYLGILRKLAPKCKMSKRNKRAGRNEATWPQFCTPTNQIDLEGEKPRQIPAKR